MRATASAPCRVCRALGDAIEVAAILSTAQAQIYSDRRTVPRPPRISASPTNDVNARPSRLPSSYATSVGHPTPGTVSYSSISEAGAAVLLVQPIYLSQDVPPGRLPDARTYPVGCAPDRRRLLRSVTPHGRSPGCIRLREHHAVAGQHLGIERIGLAS